MQADQQNWRTVFHDEGTGDWQEKWFLDGEVGTVSNGRNGMTLTAGPEFRNDAHHMVLWTKESFAGDVKIEFEYTRLDNENRAVNILFIQATGSGEAPHVKDIHAWRNLRRVPAMRTYFHNMNLYHISYAAFTNDGLATSSYLRARRYMPEIQGLSGTDLQPEYESETLFIPGVPHKITVIKTDRDLYMRVENADETFHAHFRNTDFPIVTEGRIGIRHMFTRSALYKNFTVSVPLPPLR
ncbi:MAG: DUF1961 family protein [Verrucomicrobia bacterium]|nr:DUF1961 family protein [Verrucomicrobiota bacterium]MCH8528874.1 DUF1961 family protein [Kiritimatiellia bacterium]